MDTKNLIDSIKELQSVMDKSKEDEIQKDIDEFLGVLLKDYDPEKFQFDYKTHLIFISDVNYKLLVKAGFEQSYLRDHINIKVLTESSVLYRKDLFVILKSFQDLAMRPFL